MKAAQQVSYRSTGPRHPRSADIIEIEIKRGRLRVEGAADPAALRVVLECLLR